MTEQDDYELRRLRMAHCSSLVQRVIQLSEWAISLGLRDDVRVQQPMRKLVERVDVLATALKRADRRIDGGSDAALAWDLEAFEAEHVFTQVVTTVNAIRAGKR